MTITVNAYCTHRDPPPLGFAHSLNSRRGRSDPELTEHLNGFIGFVMRMRPQMTAALYATLRHIERVQTQISFEVDPAVFDEMVGWAQQANAIFFMPDGNLGILQPAPPKIVSLSPAVADISATLVVIGRVSTLMYVTLRHSSASEMCEKRPGD